MMNVMLTHYNGFDVILLVIVALSMLIGLWRGFLKEIISVITWFAAFFVTILFSKSFSVYLSQYIKTSFLASLISFLALFIAVLVVGFIINYLVALLIKKSGMTLGDRFLGGIFGIVRGALISVLVIFVITNTVWQDRPWFQHAYLVEHSAAMNEWLQTHILTVVQKTTEPVLSSQKAV